jgi:hypothetical protein
MTQLPAALLRSLTSPRSPRAASPAVRSACLLLRLGSAGLLTWMGYIHLHLWHEGYRQIPVDGPLFLLDAIAAFALAAMLLAWPRLLAGVLAAAFAAATLGALIISLTVGLFGFSESIHASFVLQSLAIETAAILALLGWTGLAANQPGRAAKQHSDGRQLSSARPG